MLKLSERTGEGLTTLPEMALHHHRMNAIRPALDLGEDFIQNSRLAGWVLTAVGMATVDHDG